MSIRSGRTVNHPLPSGLKVYDVFEVLGFVAGITDPIALGLNICIPGYRHPAVLAKNVTTADPLADERFEFGVGAGWLETEFKVLDASFEDRGVLADEFLDLLRRMYANETVSFDGPIHQFQRTGFRPVPRDGSTPPIFVGGDSSAAMRRTAGFGDGWTISGAYPDDVREARALLTNA